MGYILGLGDRHVQNILIDTNTAELVHIDLGRSDEIEKNLGLNQYTHTCIIMLVSVC